MDFEELEHRVAVGETLPERTAMRDKLCYLELAELLRRFCAKALSQTEATAEKIQIRIAWERQKEIDELGETVAKKRREAIAKSELLRAEISKGISVGKDERELLSMALRCIGEMTGDFWMIEVANKYGEQSKN